MSEGTNENSISCAKQSYIKYWADLFDSESLTVLSKSSVTTSTCLKLPINLQICYPIIHCRRDLMWIFTAATKLGQGNIFRSVCQEFCPHGDLQAHNQGEGWGSGLGVSPGPQPWGRLWGRLQAHTWGMSRPRPGGRGLGGVYPSMHWGRHPPPSRQLLLWAVRILLECILVKTCSETPPIVWCGSLRKHEQFLTNTVGDSYSPFTDGILGFVFMFKGHEAFEASANFNKDP